MIDAGEKHKDSAVTYKWWSSNCYIVILWGRTICSVATIKLLITLHGLAKPPILTAFQLSDIISRTEIISLFFNTIR
jgi:hypothetical protein